MRNKWFCYIKIDEENNSIITSGMTFKDFISGINQKPKNMLILKGFPYNCSWCKELGLEYITPEKMEDFLQENVYHYGDFCWIDFQDKENLNFVTKQELAELLYLSHKKIPLQNFQFNTLKNRYVYLCHDDDYIVNIYMQSLEEYKDIIQYKILSELKGRKRSIEPIPEYIIDKLYDLFKEGYAFDFENAYNTGVRVLPIGEIHGVETIHSKLDRQRNIPGAGICVDYNSKTKKWKIY